jgi:hypothetical protein
MTPELYHPVLDCFVQGLPHTYRDVNSNWPRDFRRLWRPMVSAEGIGPMGTVEPIERSGRVASDDTAAIGVARFHQGH